MHFKFDQKYLSFFATKKEKRYYIEMIFVFLKKTSIRYAKENDREKKREREKGRRRDIEREGEIREREREREM